MILLPFAVVELFLFICAFRGVSSRVTGCPSGSFVPCTRNIYVKMTSPSFQQDVSDVGVTQYEMHLVIEASPAYGFERKHEALHSTELSMGHQ